jgi:hypothetical protein
MGSSSSCAVVAVLCGAPVFTIYSILEHAVREINLTIDRSGTGQSFRHPGQIPFSVFMVLVVGYTAIAPNFDQPSISYAFASAVIFLFVARSQTGHWIAALIAAAVFSLCQAFFPQGIGVAGPSPNLYAGMLGRGSLLVLGWRTIWASPEERRRLLRISLIPVGIVLFVLASLVVLNLTSGRSQVLDSYLYVFDGSLGFQPSFVLGQFFERYKPAAELARTAYLALPLVFALACAGYLKYGSPWPPLGILASAGVLGYLLYFVFPATGPLYVRGASFPGSPHTFATLREIHPHAIALAVRVPRNAMPSLHMAWALLLWFNCRPFSRIARGFTLLYVALTVVATLGTGEHYLADLAVAVPFSVAVQALWTPAERPTRYIVLASATSLTLIWLMVLRYGSGVFLVSPVIPWACVVVSTASSLALERVLRQNAGKAVRRLSAGA